MKRKAYGFKLFTNSFGQIYDLFPLSHSSNREPCWTHEMKSLLWLGKDKHLDFRELEFSIPTIYTPILTKLANATDHDLISQSVSL